VVRSCVYSVCLILLSLRTKDCEETGTCISAVAVLVVIADVQHFMTIENAFLTGKDFHKVKGDAIEQLSEDSSSSFHYIRTYCLFTFSH